MKWSAWLDRVVLYFPVILMGVLAAASYWLLQRASEPGAARADKVLRAEPDYIMRDFSVRTFDLQGQPKSELSGAVARHFPLTDTFEIEQVRILSVDAHGGITEARAKRALTNADASRVELMGQAQVLGLGAQTELSANAWRVSGEHLQAFLEDRRLVSNKPLTAQRGKDRFSADTGRFDDRAQELVLQGRVRGEFMPAPSPAARKP